MPPKANGGYSSDIKATLSEDKKTIPTGAKIELA
jgi:hypothetical protein